MDGVRLTDRLAYGAGCAAKRIGFVHDAFRPKGPEAPLGEDKRFLRLPVAYVLPGGSWQAPAGFAAPFRQAWADWSYLQVGDYLTGPEGTVFVASIEPPKPILVVMTNAVLSLSRPAAPVLPGINSYGAITSATLCPLVRDFPASLLLGGGADRPKAGLPDDLKLPGFTALLPNVVGIQPRISDIIVSQRGERFAVTAVEFVAGIWRISLAQATN